jgi:hypothetical protein
LVIEEAKAQERTVAVATVNIQRVFRGMVDRNRIRFKSRNATEIQRIFRASMGRKKATSEKQARLDFRRYALKKYFCMQIQKCFRGYYSRKYRSNHSDRKRFIDDLEETGRRVREMMYDYSMNQAIREEKVAKEKQERDFEHYAGNLHHLLSTTQIRGVFNPPKEYMIQPTWRDVPVEDHVRASTRDLLRTRGIRKTEMIVDMNGTKKVPLRGLKSRLSIQASAPYDAIEKAMREKKMLHTIITKDKGTWFAGGKTDIINPKPVLLNSGDTYIDANLNPLLMKGVPESQAQLIESARTQKTLFQPPLERPFYNRAGGNKSSVHPNDLFDVIGDAEESGGVTKRAFGTGQRFGLSDNADYRPADGVAPEPPLRASVIRQTRPRINRLTVRARPTSVGDRMQDGYGLSGVADYEKAGTGSPSLPEQAIDPFASSDDEDYPNESMPVVAN